VRHKFKFGKSHPNRKRKKLERVERINKRDAQKDRAAAKKAETEE
jgi:hypothetical protein